MGTFREERRGAVEIWTLDAEDTRNAISRAVLAELETRVARVAAGHDVRVVIVTGAHRGMPAPRPRTWWLVP